MQKKTRKILPSHAKLNSQLKRNSFNFRLNSQRKQDSFSFELNTQRKQDNVNNIAIQSKNALINASRDSEIIWNHRTENSCQWELLFILK